MPGDWAGIHPVSRVPAMAKVSRVLRPARAQARVVEAVEERSPVAEPAGVLRPAGVLAAA